MATIVLLMAGCGASEAVNDPMWQVVYGQDRNSTVESPRSSDALGQLGQSDFNFPDGWDSYPVAVALDSAWSGLERNLINQAIEHWNLALGFEALAIAAEPPPIIDFNRNPTTLTEDGINGLYRLDEWWYAGKGDSVIASTFVRPGWRFEHHRVRESDIVFNAAHYNLTDLYRPDQSCLLPVDLYQLALHELGHLLGLGHVSESTSIMQPSIFAFQRPYRRVSKLDVLRVHFTAGILDQPPLASEEAESPTFANDPLPMPEWWAECER